MADKPKPPYTVVTDGHVRIENCTFGGMIYLSTSDAFVERVAIAMWRAFEASKGDDGALVVSGDPLDTTYLDGKLIGGLLIDGNVDMRKIARALIGQILIADWGRVADADVNQQ